MKSYVLLLLASLFYSAPAPALVVIYSHLGSYEDSARLGLALALIAPLQLLLSMQHGTSILSGTVKWRGCVRVRVWCAGVLALGSGLLAMIWSDPFILVLGFYRIGDLLFEPRMYELIRCGQVSQVFIATAKRFLFLASSAVMLLYLGASLDASFLVQSLISIGIAVVFGARGVRMAGVPLSELRGLMFGLSAAISGFVVNLPRFFLARESVEDQAFFSNTLTLVLGATLLFVALSNSIWPKVVRGGSGRIRAFFVGSIAAALMGVLLGILLFGGLEFVAEAGVAFLLGPKYVKYADLVVYFATFYFLLMLAHCYGLLFVYFEQRRLFLIFNILHAAALSLGLSKFALGLELERYMVILNVEWSIYLLALTLLLTVVHSRDRSRSHRVISKGEA